MQSLTTPDLTPIENIYVAAEMAVAYEPYHEALAGLPEREGLDYNVIKLAGELAMYDAGLGYVQGIASGTIKNPELTAQIADRKQQYQNVIQAMLENDVPLQNKVKQRFKQEQADLARGYIAKDEETLLQHRDYFSEATAKRRAERLTRTWESPEQFANVEPLSAQRFRDIALKEGYLARDIDMAWRALTRMAIPPEKSESLYYVPGFPNKSGHLTQCSVDFASQDPSKRAASSRRASLDGLSIASLASFIDTLHEYTTAQNKSDVLRNVYGYSQGTATLQEIQTVIVNHFVASSPE